MKATKQSRDLDQLIDTLERGERFDDVSAYYERALRLRWRRWPDLALLGGLIAVVTTFGRAWAEVDRPVMAISGCFLLILLVWGGRRLLDFVRLDHAVSGWKGVADARAAAAREP